MHIKKGGNTAGTEVTFNHEKKEFLIHAGAKIQNGDHLLGA